MQDKPITSYAQHAEDITLLQGFKNQKTGFYVDVGAASPTQHSVTKLFYDRGWSGINVEPIQEQYELLCAHRPRDINVQAVIDTDEGIEKLFIFPTLPGLTTTHQKIAKTHIKSGLKVKEVQIPKTKLEVILQQYCTQTIDFLKVDVEGSEANVLESFDIQKWQPRVMIIEATQPGTMAPSHQKWEPTILEAGYAMVQFDGLNRFYVLKSETDLCEKLSHKAEGFKTISVSTQHSALGK